MNVHGARGAGAADAAELCYCPDMKRFGCWTVATAIVCTAAGAVAQTSTAAPPNPASPAPGNASGAAPSAAPPAAPPNPAGEAPTQTPTPPAAPPPPPAGPPPALKPGGADAPPAYYVEPPSQGTIVEPPIPGQGMQPGPVWEPPPPPQPRHVAPKLALWAGVRVGWFVPFGYLYARAVEVAPNLFEYRRVSWGDYAGPGAMVELDLGARIARNYNLFALWERGQLSSGETGSDAFGTHGAQDGGSTDFWGVGVRASSDADDFGFLTEIALGYRRARTHFQDDAKLELTSGLLEARLGVGADIRLTELVTLSPLLTFGVGTFDEVVLVEPDGTEVDQVRRIDELDGHGWFTLQLGAHFDLFGRR